MLPPSELEKPPAGTDGSTHSLSERAALPKVYRCDSRSASNGHLRLVEDAERAAEVLQKAVNDVRQHPQTLPLWAFRLSQHVNRGTYRYRQIWDALEAAAIDAGRSEHQVARVLYRSFADSMAIDCEALPLNVLIGGLH